MDDTDWLSAMIPANILQGPHHRYIYLGHWRAWESYQLLDGSGKGCKNTGPSKILVQVSTLVRLALISELLE